MSMVKLTMAFVFLSIQGYESKSDFTSWVPMQVNLTMPEVVNAGGNLTIICQYDLHGDKLYAAKLFLGDQEFYRYVPKDDPPIHVFFFSPDMKSMVTQEANEKACQVTLHGMPLSWAGLYQCEVSADLPSFQTAITSKYVTVAEEPHSTPVITVNRRIFGEGETLRARCSSLGGSPLANLTWTINGISVDSTVRPHVVDGEIDESISDLQIVVTSELSRENELTLRCSATQLNFYNSTTQLKLRVNSLQPSFFAEKNRGQQHSIESTTFLLLSTLSLINSFVLIPAHQQCQGLKPDVGL